MTNSLFHVSLAYKAAFLTSVVAEIESLAPKLNLPLSSPIVTQSISDLRVSSPRFPSGFGGFIVVDNAFCFAFTRGKVHTIATRRFMSDSLLLQDYRRLAGQESQIEAEEAYGLSLNCLRAIGFDIDGFLQLAVTNVSQLEFGPSQSQLPIFEITLKDTNSISNVEIVIDGSKEAADRRLMSLTIQGAEAQQFLRRPLIVITNALELNAKPDLPTKKIGR